jgi:hypothetical protein
MLRLTQKLIRFAYIKGPTEKYTPTFPLEVEKKKFKTEFMEGQSP